MNCVYLSIHRFLYLNGCFLIMLKIKCMQKKTIILTFLIFQINLVYFHLCPDQYYKEVGMGPLDRGLYIVESEISILLTSMRRGNLWSSNTHQDANTENLIKVLGEGFFCGFATFIFPFFRLVSILVLDNPFHDYFNIFVSYL